jgi:hypothetical protein
MAQYFANAALDAEKDSPAQREALRLCKNATELAEISAAMYPVD